MPISAQPLEAYTQRALDLETFRACAAHHVLHVSPECLIERLVHCLVVNKLADKPMGHKEKGPLVKTLTISQNKNTLVRRVALVIGLDQTLSL